MITVTIVIFLNISLISALTAPHCPLLSIIVAVREVAEPALTVSHLPVDFSEFEVLRMFELYKPVRYVTIMTLLPFCHFIWR